MDASASPSSGISDVADTRGGELSPSESKQGTGNADVRYQHGQPVYFPEELVDDWASFSRRGLYYCYTISLRGCSNTTAAPADVILAVKCDMGPEFLRNSFTLGGAEVTIQYWQTIPLDQEQVILAKRFQTTILSLLISNDHSEVSDAIKYSRELQVSVGVAYLLLPSVSGKIDWCGIKFSTSPEYDATDEDMRHCHSCKDADLLQTMDGPCCRYGLRLVAGGLFKVQNFLYKCYEKGKELGSRNDVKSELCRVVMAPMSTNTLCSFSFVPSIMYRIQCLLLSAKLKIQLGPRMQQFNITALKILEALTTDECQEEFSQESLETLGDSFLKYVTGQHLFSEHQLGEDDLTSMRIELVSNTTLCQLACKSKLVGYIRGEVFKPKKWIIPGLGYDTCCNIKSFLLSTNSVYILKEISIKSERIADTVEALVGAYLSAGGEQAAFHFIKSLGIDVKLHSKMQVERKITTKSEEFIDVKSLQEMLDYRFNDSSLLMEAMTHSSCNIAGITACNERLEFLGDAVLDHILTDYFFKQYYPNCTPELLTNLRKASVNNCCYAHAAVKAGLHKHILHSSKQMISNLENLGHSLSGSSHGWEPGIGLPKYLADLIEAIAGAIYIDSNHDKEAVWRAMVRLLELPPTDMSVEPDPVSELKELCERRKYTRPLYSPTRDDGAGLTRVVVEVTASGRVYSRNGEGRNQDVATPLAAKALLQELKAAAAVS
ncbi:unnamed protein product [Urochloa decumbens]|uniref:Uncharacterized protein n=1 Tax=Urochloa decumbens TaxID=240449 RepID=A0ABC8YFB8_9POAL